MRVRISHRPSLLTLALAAAFAPLVAAVPFIRAPAQDPPAAPSPFERLAGSWRGTQRAGAATLLERVRWTPTLRGRFLEGRVVVEDERTGAVVLEGLGILGHAPDGAGYTFHWFDSDGAAKRFAGRLDGDRLELVREAPDGRERLVFTFTAGGYAAEASRTGPTGVEAPVWRTEYRRTKDDDRR